MAQDVLNLVQRDTRLDHPGCRRMTKGMEGGVHDPCVRHRLLGRAADPVTLSRGRIVPPVRVHEDHQRQKMPDAVGEDLLDSPGHRDVPSPRLSVLRDVQDSGASINIIPPEPHDLLEPHAGIDSEPFLWTKCRRRSEPSRALPA